MLPTTTRGRIGYRVGIRWSTAGRSDASVGRVAELRRLDETYREVDRAGGHVVLVTSVRGVGKTTLADAFLDRLSGQWEPPLVGTGRCVAGVTPRTTRSGRCSTTRFPVDDVDGARQRRRGMSAGVEDRLHTLAADRPLVLVLAAPQRRGHRRGRCHEAIGSAAAQRDGRAAAREYWEPARERFEAVTTHERFEAVTATHDELRTLERLVSQKHNVFARADPTLTNGGV